MSRRLSHHRNSVFAVAVALCMVLAGLAYFEHRAGLTGPEANSHVTLATWSSQLTALESGYCLFENHTWTWALGGISNVTVINLSRSSSGGCSSTPTWRMGAVYERYMGSVLESVLFASVNNTTTSTELSNHQTRAVANYVGLVGYSSGGRWMGWFNYSRNESHQNGFPTTSMDAAVPGGAYGGSSYYYSENAGPSGGSSGCTGCTCDIWDGMYFLDFAVNYPHDDNQCYGHPNTKTWWGDGNSMTHFVWGSDQVSLVNDLGPVIMGAAIGAAVGAEGGWVGAAAGAIIGGAIAAILVYGEGQVWVDELGDIHWWSNQAFFHALNSVPWYDYLNPSSANVAAVNALLKLTYLRIGNGDWANVNSVGNPT
jgi:hypothetical protein